MQVKLGIQDLTRIAALYIQTFIQGEYTTSNPIPSYSNAEDFDGILVTIVPKTPEVQSNLVSTERKD